MPASPAASPEVYAVAVSPGVPGQAGCSAAVHDALKADLARWPAPPVDGSWFQASVWHEMRRCHRCGWSLMRKGKRVEVRDPHVVV